MKNSPKVKYVRFGTGNLIGDTIYLHRDLKDFPALHFRIESHELRHYYTDEGWSLDVKQKPDFRLLRFMLKRPSTWVQWLPVWWYDGKIIYSKYLLASWMLIISCWIFIILWLSTL